MEKAAPTVYDINKAQTSLGIEIGSTRIKTVLIGEDYTPVASGSHDWENRLENGMWTYSLEDMWFGIQSACRKLTEDVLEKFNVELTTVGSIGISAMMHGYLVFDSDGNQLVPFRTWRNTCTEQSANELTNCFGFNIPQRWSVAHLYQAILNKEPHLKNIAFITTLSGYVHWKLTGEKVLGVGDASGMFPIDSKTGDYNTAMLQSFKSLTDKKGFTQIFIDIAPKILNAGEAAGTLTKEGANLIFPAGNINCRIPLCPPEGDAGTGMVATNSVGVRTGNVSAGTSVFTMVVLEKELSNVHTAIDMVTTPDGKPVAMVHCNNCTSDLDAWVKLFADVLTSFGADIPKYELYNKLYEKAMEGAADGGGWISYNYYSGEPITGLDKGCPLLMRLPDSQIKLTDFMRTLLYSSIATLKIGMDILKAENVKLERLLGHGGLFKTKSVGQHIMASALDVPVAVMDSAGEGGPWGMALLSAFMLQKQANETLVDFLEKRVYLNATSETIDPNPKDRAGFSEYMKRYTKGLAVEQAAVEYLL